MLPADAALLDNPAYAALCGPHAAFAVVCGSARRYRPDVAAFLALPSEPSRQDWLDAHSLLAEGDFAGVVHSAGELPASWRAVQEIDLVQMVGEHTAGAASAQAIALGAADVPEILELIAETEPGPFMARTIELGDYLGIRRDGALIAMAGERLRLDGWTEISAVCTRPDHRGQGLASELVRALITGIESRGQRPFLHVMATNAGAIQLYEQLGFRVRAHAAITIVTAERRHEPPT